MPPLYATITGKYFINALHTKMGAQALMRGRILGPVANELSPFYLCEIYPSDPDQIAITTETVLQVEQLVGVYFFESKELLDVAWAEAQRLAAAREQQLVRAQKKQLAEAQKSFVRLLKAQGVRVISVEDAKQMSARLVTQQLAMPVVAAAVEAAGDD